jgi:DNA end-binding protein Ku
MSERNVWNGFLNFGLLQMPIKLFICARDEHTGLKMLHKVCNNNITMPRHCKHCEKDVPPNEIGKGFEREKGVYVPITEEELDTITPKTDKVMEVQSIVPLSDVDATWLGESFYMIPDVAGKKAYSLLAQVLRKRESGALVQLTKSGRENISLIRPFKNGLVLQYLFYADEHRSLAEFDTLPQVELRPDELKLGDQLAESLEEDFKPEHFEDSYRQRLQTLIMSKMDESVTAPTAVNVPKQQPTIDLIAALQQSLESKPNRKIKLAAKAKPVAAKQKGKTKKVA